jgi:hypothetical protein
MAEQTSPTGRYVYIEERGKPGRLIPVGQWPKGCEREFTPASERDLTPKPIVDFDIFQ